MYALLRVFGYTFEYALQLTLLIATLCVNLSKTKL